MLFSLIFFQNCHAEAKANNNDHEAKKTHRELSNALLSGYDDYMQMLLECHSKHQKRFNLTHKAYTALDVAEQETIVDHLYVATGRIH